jgi:hypothetical protein
MSEIAIRAERRTASAREKQPRYRTLRDLLSSAVPRFRRRRSGLEASGRTFEALKDVYLTTATGDT